MCLSLPWLQPRLRLCLVEVPGASLWCLEGGGWLEASGVLCCPCSAVSFVQICSLTEQSNVVMQFLRRSILEIHQMGGVASEQTSFGRQVIVLQLWGSAQLRGWLLTPPVSDTLSF